MINESIDLSQIGIWKYRPEIDKLEWSDSMFDIYGVDRSIWVPTYKDGYEKYLLEEDSKRIRIEVKNKMEKLEPISIVFRVIKDKELKYIRGYASYSKKENCFIGINTEITKEEFYRNIGGGGFEVQTMKLAQKRMFSLRNIFLKASELENPTEKWEKSNFENCRVKKIKDDSEIILEYVGFNVKQTNRFYDRDILILNLSKSLLTIFVEGEEVNLSNYESILIERRCVFRIDSKGDSHFIKISKNGNNNINYL